MKAWYSSGVSMCVVALMASGCASDDKAAPATAPTNEPAVTQGVTTTAGSITTAGTTSPPASTTLPARPPEWAPVGPGVARAVTDYLSGPGAPVTATIDSIAALVASHDPTACSTAAAALDAGGGPTAFLASAAATPDPVSVSLYADLVAATGDALTACVNAAPDADEAFLAVQLVLGYIAVRTNELAPS